jgi:hypothetical protein
MKQAFIPLQVMQELHRSQVVTSDLMLAVKYALAGRSYEGGLDDVNESLFRRTLGIELLAVTCRLVLTGRGAGAVVHPTNPQLINQSQMTY